MSIPTARFRDQFQIVRTRYHSSCWIVPPMEVQWESLFTYPEEEWRLSFQSLSHVHIFDHEPQFVCVLWWMRMVRSILNSPLIQSHSLVSMCRYSLYSSQFHLNLLCHTPQVIIGRPDQYLLFIRDVACKNEPWLVMYKCTRPTQTRKNLLG